MPHLLPLPLPHFFSSLQAGTCLCFALVPFIHFEICRSGNWYRHNLPLSLLFFSTASLDSPTPEQDPNPSIHIYAKQKAKVLCHFLVVDSCFSHNFIGMRPSASPGVCPSGHPRHSPSPPAAFPFSCWQRDPFYKIV